MILSERVTNTFSFIRKREEIWNNNEPRPGLRRSQINYPMLQIRHDCCQFINKKKISQRTYKSQPLYEKNTSPPQAILNNVFWLVRDFSKGILPIQQNLAEK